MADTLTPERVQALLGRIGKRVDGCVDVPDGELRALLLAYQQQQETCEWRIVGDGGFLTDCGRAPGDEDLYASRPCWCGRKVQVTR